MIYILCNLGQKKIPLGTKGRTSILSYREYVRPAELHSLSAEENCPTEKVASLRSVKVATPPCAANAAIPCGLAVRKQHEMLFAASMFDFENPTKRRSIIMKRKLVMLLTIVAVLAVGIGIWYNVPINLMDLEHDEVIEIVVFNGNTGNATHITDETQIEHIIENLNEIKLKRSKPSVGYSGYSFKMTIYLSDGNEADDWNNFIINSDDTIRKDPFFYKVVSEKIDYDYIAGIVN